MEYSSKYDKKFFYNYMLTHGVRDLPTIEYFWIWFISGKDYRLFPEYDKKYFRHLELFEKSYAQFYVRYF